MSNRTLPEIIGHHVPGHNDQKIADEISDLLMEKVKTLNDAISNQKASINRLLEHLETHCPDFLEGSGKCDWTKEHIKK